MEITIKIIINTDSKETPVVKVEQQPEVKPTEVVEEVKEVKVEKPEEPKQLDFRSIRKEFKANDFSNLRANYDYQTFDAYKTIIPTFHKYVTCTFQIWKVLHFFGHIKGFKDFMNYYNRGLITVGKENIYKTMMDASQTNIRLYDSQIAWENDQRINGYLLIQFRNETMLLKITQSKYWAKF